MLAELQNETRTIVLYEAPHHLLRTLTELYEALGDRKASICRELTKKHETAFQTTLSDAVDYYTANPPKGECVIVMEGRSRAELQKEAQMRWEELSVSEHVAHYIESGMDRKEAMKQAAKDRGCQSGRFMRRCWKRNRSEKHEAPRSACSGEATYPG